MRLIDIEAEVCADCVFRDKCDRQAYCWAKEMQTVDAIPVVRCRECKHWKPSWSKAGNSFSDMEYIGGCEFTNYYRSESDFCSYGERKEGADNEP